MLQHILGEKDVEGRVRKGQLLQILAALASFLRTERDVLKIVGAGVPGTLFCKKRDAGRTLMNQHFPPSRLDGIEDFNHCPLARRGSAAVAEVKIPEPFRSEEHTSELQSHVN